jgi:hypothetical protein
VLLANKLFSKHNFHKHTFCIWKEVIFSEIVNLNISYISKSGSQYIFTSEGLYRISNHWGRVSNCHWRLLPIAGFKSQTITIGYANWEDFYSNDDSSKLFYIKINETTKEINFYHKQSTDNDRNVVFRNAKETAKTMRIIKELISENDWAKYLIYDDFEKVRKEIIKELISTEKSFLEIKKRFL